MEYRILRQLRTLVAMVLVLAMLMPSVAFAAPGTLTLPQAMKSVEKQAFQGDTSIQNVVIPSGTTSIGAEAFKAAEICRRSQFRIL